MALQPLHINRACSILVDLICFSTHRAALFGIGEHRFRYSRRGVSNAETAATKFQWAEKVAVLREHMIGKVPISEVCDKHGLPPAS